MGTNIKSIYGYNDMYKITINGEVISYVQSPNGKKLKPSLDSRGYYFVVLYKNKKPKCCRVHRLIAEAFISKIEGKDFVNHIDGNSKNNSITNLEWCTHQENIKHAVRIGLKKPSELQKKITSERSKKPCIDLQTGIMYNSLKEACEATNEKHSTNIQRICEKSKKQRFAYL